MEVRVRKESKMLGLVSTSAVAAVTLHQWVSRLGWKCGRTGARCRTVAEIPANGVCLRGIRNSLENREYFEVFFDKHQKTNS